MPTGPGPRQRRATKIANRSHVTPFDRLAQWNAQIMNLGAQGSIPSIVGNTLQFVKLNASSIPGIMDNPATEDLDMNSFGIIRANRLEVDSNPAGTPYVSIIGGQSATLFVKATNTALIEMEGPQNTTIRGNSQLKIETGNSANSNDIRISPYGNLALQSLGAGGAGNGTIVMGNSSLALIDLSGNQINLDAGNNGLQLCSNTTLTIDAGSNIEIETLTNIKMLSGGGDIEIDAAGRLDLSGNQIFIDSDGTGGVNISAATDITMDAAKIDVEATTKLDLSGNDMTINSTNNIEVKAGATLDLSSDNTKLNGNTTLDITGSTIDMRYDVSMNVTQDISTNEIWIKNTGGSGYAVQRENDAGFGSSGWPSSLATPGDNTIVKIGRWVDYGGLAAVNMWTLPNTSPWKLMSDSNSVIQDGRSLVGMNLRSTYKYFLKREAQGNLQMGDFQVRQKSARFFEQNETWADTNLTNDGDIGFVEISGLQPNNSNQSFVYYGNSDVITMKNPMTLQFSSMYAYGAGGGVGWANLNWVLQSGGSGTITDNQPSSSDPGSLIFSKVGSGPPGLGPPTWYCDTAFSPGSGFINKLGSPSANNPFMILSRNHTPQSGWIVGFIISFGGINTTFTRSTTGVSSSPGTIAFDIITGSDANPTVVASDIHTHNFANGDNFQRTMRPFRNAIRYNNITQGFGIRYKLSVADPNNPTDVNKVTILGNAILIELLVIEDVKL